MFSRLLLYEREFHECSLSRNLTRPWCQHSPRLSFVIPTAFWSAHPQSVQLFLKFSWIYGRQAKLLSVFWNLAKTCQVTFSLLESGKERFSYFQSSGIYGRQVKLLSVFWNLGKTSQVIHSLFESGQDKPSYSQSSGIWKREVIISILDSMEEKSSYSQSSGMYEKEVSLLSVLWILWKRSQIIISLLESEEGKSRYSPSSGF